MSDTRSKFAEALALRKQQKIEEVSRKETGGAGTGFVDIPYSSLITDKQHPFRFLGLPYSVREKPTDSKKIYLSMILGDDDRKFRCIGPDPSVSKDWLLYRVMNKVLTRHWDKSIVNSDGRVGAFVYDYATVHPELYNRVNKNNNVSNAMERGWKFGASVLFNVIDRENMDWHRAEKKVRVLSKKASEWQDTVFFEAGVPDTLYQLIIDDIVAVDANTSWEDYDIVVLKLSDKPWYKAYHGIDDVKKIDPGIKPFIVAGGLTDEEKSWELNNFDSLFPITRYSKIKSKLGLFIQKVDKVFNTRYYDELVSLAEKEDKDSLKTDSAVKAGGFEGSKEVTNSRTLQTPVESYTAPIPSSVSAEPVKTEVRTSIRGVANSSTSAIPVEVWQGLEDGTYNGKKYLGVPKMTPEEKALVTRINEDGSFEWSPSAGPVLEGSSSHFMSPASVHVDPLDGAVFE